ncbi:MAG TPA: hypothetical protein VM198_03260 [Longimicrobiales bacterium]|nr:hypothetical protein [Longimicrobiales bacterium]
MATSPETIFKLYERQRSESLHAWLAQIGEVETLIDEAIEKERGRLMPEPEEGRLRLTYTLRLSGDAVKAVAERSIATDELQRRYRKAGFERLTALKPKGVRGATVELVAYDDSGETEDQRLTRLLAEALRKAAEEALGAGGA